LFLGAKEVDFPRDFPVQSENATPASPHKVDSCDDVIIKTTQSQSQKSMGSAAERWLSRAAGGSLGGQDTPGGMSSRGTQLTAVVGDHRTPSFPEARRPAPDNHTRH
jgi:hypothetical protein